MAVAAPVCARIDAQFVGACAQAYTGAIDLLPSYAITYNNIGVLLAKQGRTEEALAHYQVNTPVNTLLRPVSPRRLLLHMECMVTEERREMRMQRGQNQNEKGAGIGGGKRAAAQASVRRMDQNYAVGAKAVALGGRVRIG